MALEAVESIRGKRDYTSSEYIQNTITRAAGYIESQEGVTFMNAEFLLGTLIEDKSVNAILAGQGITREAVNVYIEPHVRAADKIPEDKRIKISNPYLRLTTRLKTIFSLAHDRAEDSEREARGEDILYGIWKEGEGDGYKILKSLHFDWNLHEARSKFVDLVVFKSRSVTDGLA